MDKILLERIQDLAGVKRTKKVLKEKPLAEEFETWVPKDSMLKELVNMHNRVFKFLSMYENSDSVSMSTRRRAIEMVQTFYDNLEDDWEDYIPSDVQEIEIVDEQGNKDVYFPEATIEHYLEQAKEYLTKAERSYDWTETQTYLDFSYSFSHGVLKVIKAIQDMEKKNAIPVN